MKLVIDNDPLEHMQAHAKETYPYECCGFFYGSDGGRRRITLATKVVNAKEGDQRRRFQIAPKDYQAAEDFAEENGLDLLGIYHSHPDHPAEPSEHDRSVALPFFSYIIISVKEGNSAGLRSWQLNKSRQFEEESIEQKSKKI